MVENIESEISFLRRLAESGGYLLACNSCGTEGGTRVVLEQVLGEARDILSTKRNRICDTCSENGFADVMIEGE